MMIVACADTGIEAPRIDGCPCSIQFVPVAVVGEAAPRAAPYPGSRMAVDSRGQYYIAWNTEPGAIAVYRADGKLLRTFGRQGDGPGEFRFAHKALVSPQDSLLIVDRERSTVSVFTPNGDFVRAFASRGPSPDVVFFPDGSLAAYFQLSRGRQGYPVHLLTPDGAILRSFGARKPASVTWNHRRAIAATARHTVWVGHSTEYLLEEYDTTGRVIRHVRREVPWYPRQDSIRARTRTTVEALHYEEANDRLWVLVYKANPQPDLSKFGPHQVNERGESLGRIYSVAETDELADWYLEVIDVMTQTALATARVPNGHFLRNGHYYYYVDDSTGDTSIHVVELRLVPGPSN